MKRLTLLFLAALFATSTTIAQDWIDQSNEIAQSVLVELIKYTPEAAPQLGVDGFDTEILDLKPQIFERSVADSKRAVAALKAQLERVDHPKVRQDIQIMIQALEDNLHTIQINRDNLIPYFNIPQTVYFGFRSLLDPQTDPDRYPAALERLRKYTGEAEGHDSVFLHAMDRSKERFEVDGLEGPYRTQIEKDLENFERFTGGVKELFENSGLEGWEASYDKFASQSEAYAEWLEENILPRTREDHRLPADLYADALRNVGVYMGPQELIERAQFGFAEIRNEMSAIASRIAEQRGWDSADYRDVIRRLKTEQIGNDEIIDFYRERLEQIEAIIERENIVTLPDRDARIRLASEAESAAISAPFMQPPRLIGNTGEYGTFVLPLDNPNADSEEKMDDFMFDAAAWTLTVHEARPGHEMQFAAMVENGVSTARAVFAFNSANAEGWGLYTEAVMKEYLPLEGQLISLQHRLMRAARAFIDPMLNLGQITPDKAKQFIMSEVVLSEPMATQEVDRYTFRAPGQATSYYYGLIKLQALRTETELKLGQKFNEKAFHDFILSQGLLPLELLTKAVREEFIPSQA